MFVISKRMIYSGELSGSKSLSLENSEYRIDTASNLDRLSKRSLNLTNETSIEAANSSGNSIEEQNSATYAEKPSSEC